MWSTKSNVLNYLFILFLFCWKKKQNISNGPLNGPPLEWLDLGYAQFYNWTQQQNKNLVKGFFSKWLPQSGREIYKDKGFARLFTLSKTLAFVAHVLFQRRLSLLWFAYGTCDYSFILPYYNMGFAHISFLYLFFLDLIFIGSQMVCLFFMVWFYLMWFLAA